MGSEMCIRDSIKKIIDGDWDRGFAFAKPPNAAVCKLVEFNRQEEVFIVCSGSTSLGWDIDFQNLVTEANQLSLGR